MPLNITPKHPDSQPHSGKVNTPAQTLALLATAGAGFVPLAYRAKRSYNQGWQHAPMALDAALAHLDGGGNVGVLGGHNGVYIADFDRDLPDALGHRPELADPTNLHFWRDNAPDRGKFVFRCVDALPNVLHPQIEIKALGTQAVVTGVHDSGAIIRSAGGNIPTLTYDQVADLVAHRTGAPMAAAARLDAGPPDAAAVARSVDLVTQVTAMAGVALAWKPPAPDGTAIAIMHRCPFNPPDDPHGDDDAAAVVIGADGRIGATCHHARCQARIAAAGHGGWSLLKDLAGYVAPAPNAAPEVAAIVAANRLHLRVLDFADHVPPELQAVNGYRTDATDRRIADVALGMMAERHKTTLRLSTLELSERTGLSSHTCKAAMARLVWLFTPVGEGAGPKSAQMYELASCVDRDTVNAICKNLEEISRSTQLIAGLPLSAQVGQDVFVRSLTKLTADDLADRNELRRGDGLPPVKMTREVLRRLDAITDSAGPGVLLVLDAIATYGGAMTRNALATVMHRSKYSVSRLVTRGIDLGLLLDFENRIDVHPDWENQVGTLDAICTTTGTMQRRRIAAIDARLRYTAAALDNPTLTPDERDAMYRRKNRAQKAKMDLTKDQVASYNERAAAAGVPAVERSIVLAPGTSLSDYLRYQRQKVADRRTAQAALRDLAGDLRGMDRTDAQHMAEFAGWTVAEFSQAWAYSRGTA